MNKDLGIHWKKWTFLKNTKSKGGLGFRDLETFNKALIAKQLWRIIEQLDSLASKILKSKYCPRTDALDSKFGNNSSQIWRSIRSSSDFVKEGILWRIGDGHSINISRANWLPNHSTLQIQSPTSLLDSMAKVENLIDPDSKS